MVKKIITSALMLSLIFTHGCKNKKIQNHIYKVNINDFQSKNDTLKLNHINLWKLINTYCEHPEIVFSQAMLETMHLKHNGILKTNNNIFGMKLPKLRFTTASMSQNGYAKYDCWTLSVKDMMHYQYSQKLCVLDENYYYYYLSKNYAKDVEYISKLKQIRKKYKNFFNENI
jgi:hypothetical protein